MSWEKVRLGDIAEFSNGINFGKDDYGKGIKIIGVSNFGDKFSPEYDSLTEVKEEVVKSNDYLYPGDIVFVRSNGNKELVGRCMLIDNKADKVTYSGFCIRARLKDTTKHNPTFWTYHFKNQSFRKAMAGTAVGANIQNLSQGRLAGEWIPGGYFYPQASRFLVIDMPPLTEETLFYLMQSKFPDLKPAARDALAGLYLDLQKKAKQAEITTRALDLRGLFGAIGTMRQGLSPYLAVQIGIVNKCFDLFEKEIVRDVVRTRIPEEWTPQDVF